MLITTLFFISLTMLAASVFTPRTAIFFTVKTKARGALLWLLVIGACVLILDVIAPDQTLLPTAKSASFLSGPQ